MAKQSLHPTTEVPLSINRKPRDTYQTFPAQDQKPSRTSFLVLPRVEGRFEGNKQSLFLHQLPEDILLAIAGWGLHWNKNDMQSLTNTCYRFATIFAPLRYKRYKDIGDTMMKAAIMATYSSLRPAGGNRKMDPRLGTRVPFVERLFFVTAGVANESLLADIIYCRSIAKIRWLDQEWEEVTKEPDHKKDFCLHGITAMGTAAAYGHWEIVRAILRSYLDNGLSDGNRPVCRCTKTTPLHLAVEGDILLLHNTHLATLFIGKRGQYPTTVISPKYPAVIGRRRRLCVRQLMKADASPWHQGKCSARQQSLSFSSIDLAKAPSNSGAVRVQKTAELLYNHIKQLLRREKARSSRAFRQTQHWINTRLPGLQSRPVPPPVVLAEENQPLIPGCQSRYPGLMRTCSVGRVSAVRRVPEGVERLRTVIDKVEEWHYSPTDTKMPSVSLEPTPKGLHHLKEPGARAPGHAPSNYLPKAATVYFVAPALWLTAQAGATRVAQSLSNQQNGIATESPLTVTIEEDQSPMESKSIVNAIRLSGQSNVLSERFPRDEGRTTSPQEDLGVTAGSPTTAETIRLEDGSRQLPGGLPPQCQPENQCWTLPNIDISKTSFHALGFIDSLGIALSSDVDVETWLNDTTGDSSAHLIIDDDSIVEERGSPGVGLASRLGEKMEETTTIHIPTPAGSTECPAGVSFGNRLGCLLGSTAPAGELSHRHLVSGAAQRRHRMPLSQMPLINISLSHTEVLPVGGLETLPPPDQPEESEIQRTRAIEPQLGCKILSQKQNTVTSVRMVAQPSPSVLGNRLDDCWLAG